MRLAPRRRLLDGQAKPWRSTSNGQLPIIPVTGRGVIGVESGVVVFMLDVVGRQAGGCRTKRGICLALAASWLYAGHNKGKDLRS